VSELTKSIRRAGIAVRLNALASIIRERKHIRIEDLCLEANLSMSAMYNYARLLQARFEDITFKGGVFSLVELASPVVEGGNTA